MERSVRWLDRCIAAHANPTMQNLFCIIQGGLDLELRRKCCAEMVARNTPGIAIGGLSGGEAKADYCRVVNTCTSLLPEMKPRYVMGIGYPEDLGCQRCPRRGHVRLRLADADGEVRECRYPIRGS